MVKEFKQLFLMMVVALAFIVMPQSDVFAEDTKAPVLDVSSIKVSKKNANYGETVYVSFKVTDESEIDSVLLASATVGYYNDDWGWEYDESTSTFTVPVKSRYFGKCEIMSIRVFDVYGNEANYFNSACSQVYDNYGYNNEIHVDMSAGDFTVSNGSYVAESNHPEVDFSSVKVTSKTPEFGSTAYVSFKISDESPMGYVAAIFVSKGGVRGAEGIYNKTTGYYDFEYDVTSYGDIEILNIVADDAFGNLIWYFNETSTLYDYYPSYAYAESDAIFVDLSKATMKVAGTGEDEKAPEIVEGSVSVNKRYTKRNTYDIVLEFKVKDDSKINVLDSQVWICGLAGDGSAGSITYNKTNDTYECESGGSFYGTHRVLTIKICDVYGNYAYYSDDKSDVAIKHGGSMDDGDGIYMDFSGSEYYVGILDEETDTFVSNSTMDDTSQLGVKELKMSGSIYKKLLSSGYNVKGLFEVDVDGTCDMTSEKTKVFFEVPEGFEEGDVLRIRHLLSDGTVQTQDAKVLDGKVCIDVSEFSPFMVEVKKSKDKSLFAKKGITYRALGKNKVSVKAVKKNLKKLVIPDTVKAFSKKYKVVSIDANACKGCKKLSSITIGKYVSKIGKKAFNGCKKVKKLAIKTNKLKMNKVGKDAFKGISKKVKLTLPKKKVKLYKKILKKKGIKGLK